MLYFIHQLLYLIKVNKLRCNNKSTCFIQLSDIKNLKMTEHFFVRHKMIVIANEFVTK